MQPGYVFTILLILRSWGALQQKTFFNPIFQFKPGFFSLWWNAIQWTDMEWYNIYNISVRPGLIHEWYWKWAHSSHSIHIKLHHIQSTHICNLCSIYNNSYQCSIYNVVTLQPELGWMVTEVVILLNCTH